MKVSILFLFVVGLLSALATSPSLAKSRGLRADNPGNDCFAPDWAQILSNGLPAADPYADLDGNSDASQNSSTFFFPGTVVTQLAIFCAPTSGFSVGTFPPQGDSANPASQPELNPDQVNCFGDTPQDCGAGPTIAALTAQGGVATTGGVMYEWIDTSGPPNFTPDPNLTPDAEVIVWTLPSSATLPNGAFELEFDNWCSDNFAGSPPVQSPPPSFTWNGIQYKYLAGCGNFWGDDLLLDVNSGVIIGTVINSTDNTNNTIALSSTARGWQAVTAPGGLAAAPGSGSVTLKWTTAEGATSYNVYQALTTGNEGSTPVQSGITTGSTVISGLTPGKLYFFTIAAVYASTAFPTGFLSSQSAEASATVLAAPPTGLAATAGATSITLQWTASAGASTYSVYQGTSAGGESATAVASGVTTTSYPATGLTPGQTYYFVVKAINAGGPSAASNEAKTSVWAATPTGLTATAGNGAVTLSWTASSGATSYNVYEGTSSGGENATALGSSNSATATVSGLTNGTTYFFKVSAVDAGGNSALSSEASATPMAPPKSGGGGGLSWLDLLVGSVVLTLQLRNAVAKRERRATRASAAT